MTKEETLCKRSDLKINAILKQELTDNNYFFIFTLPASRRWNFSQRILYVWEHYHK